MLWNAKWMRELLLWHINLSPSYTYSFGSYGGGYGGSRGNYASGYGGGFGGGFGAPRANRGGFNRGR